MTSNNQHIPLGYKPSPLGIIPENWDVKRLGEACDYVDYRGKSPNKSAKGIFLVTAKNIRDGYIDYDISKEFIPTDEFEETMRRGKAQIGDVLITTEAPLGHIAQIDNPNIALAQRVIKYRGKVGLRNTYLKYYLMSDSFQTILVANATGSTALGIKGSRLHQLPIVIPSLIEQDSIVSVLSLWDTAIAKQTALIEKLTLRKRGLMQQLLTGKKRLKGFEGEWHYHRIKDHFELILDKNDGKNHTPMTISAKHGLISQKNKFDRIVAGNSLDKYTLLKKGDFAYNKGNSNLYEMGCIYRLEESSAVVPFVYICFRTFDNTCCEFYQHFFINHGLDKQLKKIITSGARGDGLLNVNDKDFMMLKIPYPQIAEQRAIASILDNADKEIEIQKQKLSDLQEQKKGLMQVLLTGKRRII